jgi:hypothetical protein
MLKHHKIAIISISVVAILFFLIQWFVTRNSVFILEKIVSELSNGKYQFKASTVKFSLLSSKISGTGIQIHPVVGQAGEASYQIDADTIAIELSSIWPLFLKKSLLIENVVLANPSLIIKGKSKNIKSSGPDFNLHEYLQVVHDETNSVIHDLRLEHFRLENFSLKILTDQDRYFYIDHVFMEINELFANVDGNRKSGNYELEGGIHLWLDKPSIVYPDSSLRVSLDSLDWLSQKHVLTIDNISLLKRRSMQSHDSVFIQLHEVTTSRLNWNDWINNGRMNFDSIGASTGALYVDKLGVFGKGDTVDRQHSILKLISPISVNHFTVRAIQSNLSCLTKIGPITGSLKGDSLIIGQLTVDIVQKISVQLKRINLAVRAFQCGDSAGKWHSSFTAFRIRENQVLLNDYSIKSNPAFGPGNTNTVEIPTVALSGLSLHDLSEGRISVRTMNLEKPFVQIYSRKTANTRKSRYRPFGELFPFLKIQSISFWEGTVIIRQPESGSSFLVARGVNGHVYANKLLVARGLEEYPGSCDKLQVKTMDLNLPKSTIQLHQMNLVPSAHLIRADKLTIKWKSTIGKIEASGLKAILDSSYQFIRSRRDIYLKQLSIDSLVMHIDRRRNQTVSPTRPGSRPIALHIGNCQIAQGLLDLKNENFIIHTRMAQASFNDLLCDDAGTSWDNAKALFSETSVEGQHWNFTAESFDWNNYSLSTIYNLKFELRNEGRLISATVPRMNWSWSLHKPVADDMHLSLLALEQPSVHYQKRAFGDDDPQITTPTRTQSKPAKRFSILVDSLMLTQPNFKIESFEKRGSFTFDSRMDSICLFASSLNKNEDKKIAYQAEGFRLQSGPTSFQEAAGIEFRFSRIRSEGHSLHKKSSAPLNFWVDALSLDSLQLSEEKENKKTKISSAQISVTEPTKIYINKDSVIHMLYGAPSLSIQGADLTLDRNDHLIEFKNVHADLLRNTFALDSFSFRHKISRDSFFSSQPFEKDYISVNTGAIRAKDVQVVSDQSDSGYLIGKIDLDRFYIKAERDKMMPDDTVQYKPLLVKLIQRIPVHFALDTLALQHSTIWHNVIAEKTGEQATIYFSEVNGWLANLRNFRIRHSDSLSIRVSSKMMGLGTLLMRFRESYLDTLQGFLLAARMGKYDMPHLNGILVPLTRIRIARGRIDTLWMQAHANDLLAFGQMQIKYHQLKVEKLDEQEKKKGFISWLANIIVRTGNNKATGTIYVERLQNKSTFNYWGKIALSGLLTNIRVSSNKKNQKKYEAALKKYQLPPTLFDKD